MSEKKISWGMGILIVIIIFMLLTISTVIFLMNQDVDLVTDNYYAKEIKYQQQIDRMNRTNAMGDEIKIVFEDGFIKLSFPEVYAHNKPVGTIQFYRPSNSKKDFTVPISIDTSSQQVVFTNNFDKGFWKIKLDWVTDSVEYYKESSFIIN